MTDQTLTIGARLTAAREAAGLTQRQLAQYTGISQSTIHRIESNTRDASLLELASLADGCGVLTADLHGTSTLSQEVRCAGRVGSNDATALADYMLYAFGVSKRLDELGVPENR